MVFSRHAVQQSCGVFYSLNSMVNRKTFGSPRTECLHIWIVGFKSLLCMNKSGSRLKPTNCSFGLWEGCAPCTRYSLCQTRNSTSCSLIRSSVGMRKLCLNQLFSVRKNRSIFALGCQIRVLSFTCLTNVARKLL